MLPRLAVTFVLAAFLCDAPLSAQTPPVTDADAVAPAHVAHVEGAASLEREGRAENSPLNMPLLSGDRLRTGADGRVEVLFADGSTLHLDVRSTIDVQSDDLVRLTDGRLRLNIRGPAQAVGYRIDSPAGSARITQPGEYRVALLRGNAEVQLEVAVVRGAAEVFTDAGSTPVRAGERAYASAGLAPSYAYAYNSATWDGFDRWSESRRDVRLGVSSQYLPPDMQSYAPVLDQDGDWRYTQSDGYAWYPRVASDWRPYYYGRWASYPRYGWTWIGTERFAWPTHHYGRWGFSAGSWFWRPSSRWAPAYVSWGYAPGYVSWCPLGFDNRPVIAIDLYRAGPNYYSPWRAWTAVSVSHFGNRGYSVHQRAVNWDRFDRSRRPRFETRPSAPGFSRDIAVPRSATPIRWTGSRHDEPQGGSQGMPRDNSRPTASPAQAGSAGRDVAVPRVGVTPRYVNRGDEIMRSQTGRPAPRGPAPVGTPIDPARGRPVDAAQDRPDEATQGTPAREGFAVPRRSEGSDNEPGRTERGGSEARTLPGVPGRRVNPESDRAPAAATPGVERPMAQPFGQSRPRRYEPFGQGSPVDASQGTPRADAPYQPAAPRGDDPRASRRPGRAESPSDPAYSPPPAAARETAPRAYDRPRAGSAPPPQPPQERAAPAERAPSRGEGSARQPPPDRQAAPRDGAASRPGAAVPRRGGRGGS